MTALILNSGMGTRMGDIGTCKCLVEIAKDTTIVDIQMRVLLDCGVSDICMTTGPYADRLENYLRERYPNINFTFVNNPLYKKTNYIYSIHIAQEYLIGDILLMHGDLIFEKSLLEDVIACPDSCMVVDNTKPLPDKDFKAVIRGGKISAVGVNYFEDAVYAQPLYKLFADDWLLWVAEISRFCQMGNTGVYAEDALNIELLPLDAKGRHCFEVDNENDLKYAKAVFEKCN